MLDAVEARLEAQVPALQNRVEGASAWSALLAGNAAPQHTPAAYVIPLGWSGGAVDVAAGLFRQTVSETVGVLIFFRSRKGAAAEITEKMRAVLVQVIKALCGWAPGDELGVFQLTRGQLISAVRGLLVFQLDFSINDQLRITL